MEDYRKLYSQSQKKITELNSINKKQAYSIIELTNLIREIDDALDSAVSDQEQLIKVCQSIRNIINLKTKRSENYLHVLSGDDVISY